MLDREFKTASGEQINIHYDHEKAGFELISGAEEPDMSYEFNTYIVLRDKKTRKFYGAGSSGCSCPTPFEEYVKLSDLLHLPNINVLEMALKEQYAYALDAKHKRTQMKNEINDCLAGAKRKGLGFWSAEMKGA